MPKFLVPGVMNVLIPIPVLAWVDLVRQKAPPDVLRKPRVAAAPAVRHQLVPVAEVTMITIAVGAGSVRMVTKRAMPTTTAIGNGTAHIMSPPLPNATGDICAWVKATTALVHGSGTVVMILRITVAVPAMLAGVDRLTLLTLRPTATQIST